MKYQTLARSFANLGRRIGVLVLHPVVGFLFLITITAVLSHVLYLAKITVSHPEIISVTHEYHLSSSEVVRVSSAAQSLLTASGIRDMYDGLIGNFTGFTALALLIVSMVGIGVAEESGLIDAVTRLLDAASPRWLVSSLLAFAGIACGIAFEAAFVVWIPICGLVFRRIGRNPIAGLVLGYAAVGAALNMNMLIRPVDVILTEFTNDAIHLVNSSLVVDFSAGVWITIAAVPFLTALIALITDRIVEPRLNKTSKWSPADGGSGGQQMGVLASESRGLRYAALGFLGVLVLFGLLALPAHAPLRSIEGSLVGDSPFMHQLIVPLTVLSLVTGIMYGFGARTIKSAADIADAMTKSLSGLGGTILLILLASQFIACLDYSNIPTMLVAKLADVLMAANLGPYLSLLGLFLFVAASNLFFTPAIAKWAILAPMCVPYFMSLGVDPADVLCAYRVGASPITALTPVNAYFILVIGLAQKYDKNATVASVFRMLLPYAIWINVLWLLFFAAWFGLQMAS